jgi:glyoxylase-like metal-dependent hydrolase (beta-lactamase superfamily II)
MGVAKKAQRIVTDSMLGLEMPDIDQWSERVTVVLGQNPGPFTGPGTNTYVIGTGSDRILLDAGQGLPAYLDVLARALDALAGGPRLERLLLTHAHVDHLGGAASVMERFGPLPAANKMPWPELDGTVAVEPIGEGAVIATEGATLRALWTPGHARDHLCYYLEEERALFTGDVVLGAGTTVIPRDGDLALYLDSLQRILALDLAVIYPAHGPAIHNPRVKVRQILDHRALRDEQILEGLADGISTVTGLVDRIYTDIPAFLHPAAGVSVEAHLRKLDAEGKVRHEGERWVKC